MENQDMLLDLRAVLTYAHHGIHAEMERYRQAEDYGDFNTALDMLIALEHYAQQQGFRNMDAVLAGEPPLTAPVMEQAFLVACWELGLVAHPATPPDLNALAAEYLARKFRVGQRLRFVGGGMNLGLALLDPDTEVDLLNQVGTVVATPTTRMVQIRFDAWPDYPIRMYAADDEFELVGGAQ